MGHGKTKREVIDVSHTMVSGIDYFYCSDTSFEESIFLPRTKLCCLKEGTTMGIICTMIR